MSANKSGSIDDLPLDVLKQVNEICEGFERALRAESSPALITFLERTPAAGRRACFEELLGLELDYRRSQGKVPEFEEVLALYPEFRDSVRLVWHEPAAIDSLSGPPPADFGDYRILREIGRGGMGIVYLAEQISLDRQVAIKILSQATVLDPVRRKRFQREAKAAAALQHPNIVPIYGVGCHNQYYYYVMRFVPGHSLDRIIRQLATADNCPDSVVPREQDSVANQLLSPEIESAAPPDPCRFTASDSTITGNRGNATDRDYFHRAAKIIQQAAEGLAFAHRQGILHRDVKPSNLLLDDEGKIWITDFGLAKSVSDSQQLTHSGDVAGTLKYMAPEAFDGKHDFRSDIYGLGLTLYELLTWQSPFEESDRGRLIEQVLHGGEPLPPRKVKRRVPRDLETICLKCVQKEANERYVSAAELAEDLRRYLAGEPIRARPVPFWTKTILWARRNPLIAGLALLAMTMTLGALAGLALGIVTINRHARSESARADAEALQAKTQQIRAAEEQLARTRERALRQTVEANLVYSRVALAERSWMAGEVAAARRILALCDPRPGEVDYRGWEWSYVNGLCHSELLILPHRFWVNSVAFHPQGAWLATGAGSPGSGVGDLLRDSELKIWNVTTGVMVANLVAAEQPMAAIQYVTFSADGRWLLARDAIQSWHVWDTTTWRPRFSIRGSAAAFLPDDRTLGVINLEGDLLHYDLSEGKGTRTLWNRSGGRTTQSNAAFSHDRRFVAIRTIDLPNVNVVDALTGQDLAQFQAPPSPGEIALSSGAERMVDCGQLFGVSSGRLLGPLSGEASEDPSFAPTFSPDGRWLTWNMGARDQICLTATDSKVNIRFIRGHAGEINQTVFSDDSQLMATASTDGSVRVWEMSGLERRVIRGHTSGVRSLAFSPDQRLIASASQDGTVRLWDWRRDPRGMTVPQQSTAGENVNDFAFSPDGHEIAVARHTGLHTLDIASQREVCYSGQELAITYAMPRQLVDIADSGTRQVGVAEASRKTVKVWDLEKLRAMPAVPPPNQPRTASDGLLYTFEGHTADVRCVAADGEGNLFASLAFDATATSEANSPTAAELKLWNAEGQVAGWRTFPGLCLALSDDGRLVAASAADGNIRVWEVKTGRQRFTWTPVSPVVTSLDFSRDGNLLAASTLEGVPVWDTNDGGLRTTVYPSSQAMTCVAFSPDGQRLATIGMDEGVVHLWDVVSGENVFTLRGFTTARPNSYGYFARVIFSRDGRRIAANHWNASISIWEASAPSQRRQ